MEKERGLGIGNARRIGEAAELGPKGVVVRGVGACLRSVHGC